MLRRLTPAVVLFAAALVAALLALFATLFALRQPWLGLRFATVGDGLVTIGSVDPSGPSAALPVGAPVWSITGANHEPFLIQEADLLEEPDVSENYAAMAVFFARQSRLANLLRGGAIAIAFSDRDAIHEIAPRPARPVDDLPVAFWVQLFVGAASFVIGAWVWSLRRDDAASRILFGVGASTLTFSFAAAVYSIRELAVDGAVFRALSALNHLGALGFGACMIALFLTYPRRIVRPGRLLVLPAVFGVWWLADTLRIGFSGPAEGSHLPTLVEMIGILAAIGLQYWRTRGDARARAALRWFGLSVAVGAGAFVFMIIAPNLFGAAPLLSQGYAFLFFLLVFVGVALGVARYRLFELETWAFRILFYLGGVILLLALDSLLIYVASLDRAPALSLSLVATALLYLPLRTLLTGRLLTRGDNRQLLFREVIDVALAVSTDEQDRRWRQLLQSVFDPLQNLAGDPVDAPVILEDGIALALPGVGRLAPRRLLHARGGRRLFSSRDAALAAELRAMLGHAVESRGAYEKGVAEERARIARDMHDNIGAQLLSALHIPATERKDSMIRETLSDLRSIINNAAPDAETLGHVLADLRFETAERLESAGLSLEWRSDADLDPIPLAPAAVHAIRSILRETVSNTVRHAGASAMVFAFGRAEDVLRIEITDNGRGLAGATRLGNGLANIRERAASLRGAAEFTDASPGLRLTLRFPL